MFRLILIPLSRRPGTCDMQTPNFVEEAGRYWSLANILTGFYFAQALAFWYKLGEKDFVTQISGIPRAVLALLWVQAGAVAFLVYGCLILERRLLGQQQNTCELIATSELASYARIVVVVLITTVGSALVWFVSGQGRDTTVSSGRAAPESD